MDPKVLWIRLTQTKEQEEFRPMQLKHLLLLNLKKLNVMVTGFQPKQSEL